MAAPLRWLDVVLRIGLRRNTDTDNYAESTDSVRVNRAGDGDISQAMAPTIGHFAAAVI